MATQADCHIGQLPRSLHLFCHNCHRDMLRRTKSRWKLGGAITAEPCRTSKSAGHIRRVGDPLAAYIAASARRNDNKILPPLEWGRRTLFPEGTPRLLK